MAQAIWSGSISFGLVAIPVRLYPATRPSEIRFREVQRGTGQRIRHQRVVEEGTPGSTTLQESPQPSQVPPEERAPATGSASRRTAEVPYDQVVKGFDLGDDRLVTVTPEELQELRPAPSRTIGIEQFVDLGEIDPIFFEKSYYLAPQRDAGAEKPYVLLLRAMQDAHKIGIASFVLRTKEHLAAIRPIEGALGLETLFYPDEVRPVSEIANVPVDVDVSDRELKLAQQLIETLAGPWVPERYRDTFRDRVLELIQGKAGEARVVAPADQEAPSARVADLMDALKESVEQVKAAQRQEKRSQSSR